MAEQLPKAADQFDRELDFSWITKFMVALVLVTVGAFGTMWLMSTFIDDRMAASQPEGSPLLEPGQTTTPPLPHLQVSSYTDWTEMKAAHDHELATYGWIDQSAGRVRIPITNAMDDIAAHGLPVFEATGDGTLETGGAR
ncbi:hypothetical protein DRQ53_07095 [bacterium]|nr:MAG: hypothetical protein DRQ32_04840 [bacterium]RKZ16150.1 MAG: hypothetical protein DRQ53_07095 [bacterium]